jgi:hypothetical protein
VVAVQISLLRRLLNALEKGGTFVFALIYNGYDRYLLPFAA